MEGASVFLLPLIELLVCHRHSYCHHCSCPLQISSQRSSERLSRSTARTKSVGLNSDFNMDELDAYLGLNPRGDRSSEKRTFDRSPSSSSERSRSPHRRRASRRSQSPKGGHRIDSSPEARRRSRSPQKRRARWSPERRHRSRSRSPKDLRRGVDPQADSERRRVEDQPKSEVASSSVSGADDFRSVRFLSLHLVFFFARMF